MSKHLSHLIEVQALLDIAVRVAAVADVISSGDATDREDQLAAILVSTRKRLAEVVLLVLDEETVQSH